MSLTKTRGWTPLHHAAKDGDVGEVERLIAASEPVDIKTTTTHFEGIISLSHSCSALHIASAYGNAGVVQALLRHGAAISLRNADGFVRFVRYCPSP